MGQLSSIITWGKRVAAGLPPVGSLTVLYLAGLILAACQPVQPLTQDNATATHTALGAVITATVVTTDTGASSTAGLTITDEITATVTATTAVTVTDSAITTTTNPSDEAANSAANDALLAAGLAVYRAQYCGICHILEVAGTRGTFGPSHDGIGATAAARVQAPEYTGNATNAAGYLLESIVEPGVYIVEGYGLSSHRMPPYGHLPAADLEALVAFLLAQ